MSFSDLGAVGGLLSPLVMIVGFLWLRRQESHTALSSEDREIRDTLNSHLLECARKNGVMETKLETISGNINTLGRQIGSLQSQMRALASGTHSRLVSIEDDND